MERVPYFEDFTIGDEFSDVPSVTLTEGYASLHQALFSDRTRMPLDQELCRKVTGRNSLVANASLVSNFAIGQSTIPSQRVMGNLFYRGLHFQRPVFLGDTPSLDASGLFCHRPGSQVRFRRIHLLPAPALRSRQTLHLMPGKHSDAPQIAHWCQSPRSDVAMETPAPA